MDNGELNVENDNIIKVDKKKRHKEKYYENKVKEYIKSRGGWFIKYWGGGSYTRPGVPDLLCCYKGRFIAIEMKNKGGRISAIQREEMAQIERAGGIGMFVYPDDINAVVAVFKALEKGLEVKCHYETERKRKKKKSELEQLSLLNC